MDKSLMLGAGQAEPIEIDYKTYRFGRAKQAFRGPAPDLDNPYIAIIGGTETYGKFVTRPYSAQLAEELPLGIANWSTIDAGPTFYLTDTILLNAIGQADLAVVSITHGFHVSNRMYKVFPRRNGQVMEISEVLLALYPQIDFREFRFVRPMLRALWRTDAESFKFLEGEIQLAWVARMQELCDVLPCPVILGWLSDRTPDDIRPFDGRHRSIGPAMVTREMIDEVIPFAASYVECVVPPGEVDADRMSRVFSEEERGSALMYPGEDMHAEMTEILYPVIKSALSAKTPKRARTAKLWKKLGL